VRADQPGGELRPGVAAQIAVGSTLLQGSEAVGGVLPRGFWERSGSACRPDPGDCAPAGGGGEGR